MSCNACDEETNRLGERPVAYVRVGTGNIAVAGCQVHLRELIDKLRCREAEAAKLNPSS
jgi:hypothetical protein